MDKNNLEKNEEFILSKENLGEILELEKENIVEVDFDEVEAVKATDSIRVSRDNYTEQEVLDKMCIICGKTNCRGIVIMDKKICLECEEKAVRADIKSDFYSDYKDKIIKNVVGKLKNQNLG